MSCDDFGRREILAGLGAGAALTLGSRARAAGPARVVTPVGSFVGTAEDGVRAFRGIRYGTARRFLAPEPYAAPGKVIPAANERSAPRKAAVRQLPARKAARLDPIEALRHE